MKLEQRAIVRAQRGDAEAISFLYAKHRAFVQRRCLALTADFDAAEDLTQEVFLQVCRKILSFKGNSSFKTWLYRVATNVVMMQYRKNKPQLLSLDQPISTDEGDQCLSEIVPARSIRLDDCLLLSQAVSGLSSYRREILLLHDLKGYKHREIARILGIRNGTSKSQLHRARVRVRAMFDRSPEKGRIGNTCMTERSPRNHSVKGTTSCVT